jgi:hypothetical protein
MSFCVTSAGGATQASTWQSAMGMEGTMEANHKQWNHKQWNHKQWDHKQTDTRIHIDIAPYNESAGKTKNTISK